MHALTLFLRIGFRCAFATVDTLWTKVSKKCKCIVFFATQQRFAQSIGHTALRIVRLMQKI